MEKMKLNIQLFAWSEEKAFSAWPNVSCAVGVSKVERTGNNIKITWGSRIRTSYTSYGYTLAGSSYWAISGATSTVSPTTGGGNSKTSNRYVGKGKSVSVTKNQWYYTDKNWPLNREDKDPYAHACTTTTYPFTTTVTVSSYAAGSFKFASSLYTSDGGKTQVTNTVSVSYPAATLTVTYDLNEGQGDSTTQSITYNTTFTTHEAPTRTGYTFIGWLGDNGVTYEANTSYTLTDYLVLTAQWSINSYPLHLKGRLSLNGGASYTIEDDIVDYGTVQVFINDVPLTGRRNEYNTDHPYLTDYAFANILADAGHVYEGVYSGAAIGTIGAAPVDVILQFRTAKYTIVYNNKDGIGSVNPQIKIYGTNLILTSSYPTKDGYDFLGWDTNSAGTTVVYHCGDTLSTDLSSTDGATVTLYAVWRETAPSNVRFTTAEVVGPFNINLAWTCIGLNITNYTLEYKVHSASSYTSFNCGTSTSLSLFPVNEETAYDMRIKATNPGGSTYSNVIQLTTPADQAKIRIYNGSAWVQGKTYIYNGSAWVKAKKVYIYDGSTWRINSNN